MRYFIVFCVALAAFADPAEARAHRQTQFGQVQEEPAGQFEAFFNPAGIVQTGIVDKPLPADPGARFFKINPHDEQQGVLQLVRQNL